MKPVSKLLSQTFFLATTAIAFVGTGALRAETSKPFSVVAYNLENVFDLDGRAEFSDYKMSGDKGGKSPAYSPAMLLRKVEGHAQVLKTIGDGTGPEVILIQELERDQTPESGITSPSAFLASPLGRTPLRELLREPIRRDVAGLPSYAIFLKALHEAGMGPYYVALPDNATNLPANYEPSVHTNAVFSKFPIAEVYAFPTPGAREILEAHLNVHGHRLIVFSNHWKAGASNPDTEPTRVENARTLRSRLDTLLKIHPQADIVVGGDLNTYYNQKRLFNFKRAAINDVLRSIGDETRMDDPRETALYNLWYELPPDRRYTEVWRGMYGTLMHLLVTNGLYDRRGIAYVDNSFTNVIRPGLNTDHWGRPLSWRKEGGGSGLSDHLPIVAQFRVVSPGYEDDSYDQPRMIDYSLSKLPNGYIVRDLEGPLLKDVAREPSAWRGDVFRVKGERVKAEFPAARIGSEVFRIWSPNEELLKKFSEMRPGTTFETHAEVMLYDGRPEIVILDPSWVETPKFNL